MRKLLFISFVLISTASFGQYNWDFGVDLGGSNYLGEMGGNEKSRRGFVMDMKMQNSNLVYGGFARYRLKENLSIKMGFTMTTLEGADSLSTNPGRMGRNLSFKNNIWEVAAVGEYYFFTSHDVGGTGRYQLDFTAYGFGGLAVFHHNPKATGPDGVVYSLRDLNTENRLKPYSLTSLAIPIGFGLHYTYKKKHRFGWSFGWRTTFSDYIDDVSTVYADPDKQSATTAMMANRRGEVVVTDLNVDILPTADNYGVFNDVPNKRGDPSHNDSYLYTTAYYSYVLRGKRSFVRAKHSYVYGGNKRRRKGRAKF